MKNKFFFLVCLFNCININFSLEIFTPYSYKQKNYHNINCLTFDYPIPLKSEFHHFIKKRKFIKNILTTKQRKNYFLIHHKKKKKLKKTKFIEKMHFFKPHYRNRKFDPRKKYYFKKKIKNFGGKKFVLKKRKLEFFKHKKKIENEIKKFIKRNNLGKKNKFKFYYIYPEKKSKMNKKKNEIFFSKRKFLNYQKIIRENKFHENPKKKLFLKYRNNLKKKKLEKKYRFIKSKTSFKFNHHFGAKNNFEEIKKFKFLSKRKFG